MLRERGCESSHEPCASSTLRTRTHLCGLRAHSCSLFLGLRLTICSSPPCSSSFLPCLNPQVRSFTVLDGIGKSLDPRFDISEIAAPYARELLLEGAPQVMRVEVFRWRS